MSLTEVLPGRAGDPDHRAAELAPPPRAPATAAPRAGRRRPAPSPRRRSAAAAQRRARARPPRPRRRPRARAANSPPSARSPRQAEEEVAGPALARVDHRPLGAAAGRSRATSAPAAAAIRSGSKLDHAPAWRASSQLLARDLAVVEGHLAPASNSWPCSWPLPAITTVSPSRRPERQRDRRPPVGLDLDPRSPPGRPSRPGSRR